MTNPKTVLITGATSGIGRHSALYLARKGLRVIATGRRKNALAELAKEAKAEGLTLDTLRLDVTDDESIAAARTEVGQRTGGRGIDVLVNNAGFGTAAPMSEITDAELRRQYDTNVFGLMAVTRAFLPQMQKRRSGKIINVSSVGGRLTLPMFGGYNSTKYAVESMSDALRIELRPFGIRVVLIEPGIINTNFTQTSVEKFDGFSGSAYGGAITRFEGLAARSERMGVGPQCIARAIYRAIRRRRPAARYIAPFRTRIFLGFYRVMPTSWNDALFRRIYGFTRKNMLEDGKTGHAQLSSSN